VYTDHYPLSFLKNLSNLNSRIHRYACLLEGYDYEVKFKNGADNISDIISRLDYANQLKPSDDSVVKCNENISKIDFIFDSKTNVPITEQSPQVQDTLSEFTLLTSKSLSESQETGTNRSVKVSIKKDSLPLMDTCPKPINIGTPITLQDVSKVHLEAENDYILPINFEAVLDENLYSDTVYTAAESMTSEGILTDIFQSFKRKIQLWPMRTYLFMNQTISPKINRVSQKIIM